MAAPVSPKNSLSMLDIGARGLFFVVMAIAIVWSFHVNELKNFQQPELARILFWHLPCPVTASVLLCVGAYYSFRQFRSNDLRWDVKAVAALELGMIFCILTMATGMIFSRVQWGAWWQNDPRQTSFAMVLMIYFAYFVLRAALPDRQRKAVYSAGYALAATLPVLFLIYVFPRLPQIDKTSLHPTSTIMSGQVNGSYGEVLTTTMTLVGILALWMFRLRVRAGELELKTYESIGLETHGNNSATARVVRSVRLPDASGGQASQGPGEPGGERA